MYAPKIADCDKEDGWTYSDPQGPYETIVLCGSWCTLLKDVGTIKAEFYCLPG